MGVCNAIKELTDPQVAAYLVSTVKESDARDAYYAPVDLTQVAVAAKLSAATPPFHQRRRFYLGMFSKPHPRR